jgi:hypothetical protein
VSLFGISKTFELLSQTQAEYDPRRNPVLDALALTSRRAPPKRCGSSVVASTSRPPKRVRSGCLASPARPPKRVRGRRLERQSPSTPKRLRFLRPPKRRPLPRRGGFGSATPGRVPATAEAAAARPPGRMRCVRRSGRLTFAVASAVPPPKRVRVRPPKRSRTGMPVALM